jgi:hypothetical protein
MQKRVVRPWLAIITLAGVSAIFPAPLYANVIFNNITGNCCGGNGVTGSNFASESLATEFTPSVSATLTDAKVVVFQVLGFGGDPNFNVSLFSNVGASPGMLIEQLGTDLTAPVGGGIVTATPSASFQLIAGTGYWLVLTPFDSNTEVSWEQGGSLGAPTDFTTSPVGAGPWVPVSGTNPLLQFEIDGVPEPGSALLLAGGFGILIALRRFTTARGV